MAAEGGLLPLDGTAPPLLLVLDGLLSQATGHERAAPQVITLSPPAARVRVLPGSPFEQEQGPQQG